jgi:hypothetical protein
MRGKRADGGKRHDNIIVTFLESMVRKVNLRRWAEFPPASIVIGAGIIRQRHRRSFEGGMSRHCGVGFGNGLTRAGGEEIIGPSRVDALKFLSERAWFCVTPALSLSI